MFSLEPLENQKQSQRKQVWENFEVWDYPQTWLCAVVRIQLVKL
jgi:hypothetical protein